MRFRIAYLLFLSIIFWIGCGDVQVSNKAYNTLLRSLLAHSVNETTVASIANDSLLLFLDAREQEEYNVSHIKNSKFVGFNQFDINVLNNTPKNTKIVVYCSIGYRSEKVAEKLVEAGYTNVSNLVGGIFEWVNQGNPVYDSIGITSNIHAYNSTWGIWLNK